VQVQDVSEYDVVEMGATQLFYAQPNPNPIANLIPNPALVELTRRLTEILSLFRSLLYEADHSRGPKEVKLLETSDLVNSFVLALFTRLRHNNEKAELSQR